VQIKGKHKGAFIQRWEETKRWLCKIHWNFNAYWHSKERGQESKAEARTQNRRTNQGQGATKWGLPNGGKRPGGRPKGRVTSTGGGGPGAAWFREEKEKRNVQYTEAGGPMHGQNVPGRWSKTIGRERGERFCEVQKLKQGGVGGRKKNGGSGP